LFLFDVRVGPMQPQGRQELARFTSDVLEVGMTRVLGKGEPTLIGIRLGTVPNAPSSAPLTTHIQIEAIVPLDCIGGSWPLDGPGDGAPVCNKTRHELETPVLRTGGPPFHQFSSYTHGISQ